MNEIKVLPSNLADKIAAGEVVERPSSVVKELVENAIDAGADRITVEAERGGVGLLRVTDNGSGIPRTQVPTAFLRHATSKISDENQLSSIHTMGFRGEALSSICAVAGVEIITKTENDDVGVHYTIDHGIAGEPDEIACGNGTIMTVRELFANVPARMKFLKKDSTEAGYISDVMLRLALSKPNISFEYILNKKTVFKTSGDGDLVNVILKVYGLDVAKACLPVDYSESGVRITGVIGKPELSFGNRNRQTLFVNGRYVKNHVVAKVAEEAYRNSMMVGKFPFFVLNIDMPLEMVDVNVHPAKTEVKFANEKQLYDIVYHAVKNTQLRKTAPPPERPRRESVSSRLEDSISIEDAIKKYLDTAAPDKRGGFKVKSESLKNNDVYNFFDTDFSDAYNSDGGKNTEDAEKKSFDTSKYSLIRGVSGIETDTDERKYAEYEVQVTDEFNREAGTREEAEGEIEAPDKAAEPKNIQDGLFERAPEGAHEEVPYGNTEEIFQNRKIIGQLFNTYVIIESHEKLYMIDQHAAHERAGFEELKRAYKNSEPMSQRLMTPIVISLTHSEFDAAISNIDEFARFGFEIEDFGTNTVLVNETPIITDESGIKELFFEILNAIIDNIRHPIANFEEKALDMISCKKAIKANDKLALPEMEAVADLVAELYSKGITTCPHGRPIMISYTKREIEKMFKRIV